MASEKCEMCGRSGGLKVPICMLGRTMWRWLCSSCQNLRAILMNVANKKPVYINDRAKG